MELLVSAFCYDCLDHTAFKFFKRLSLLKFVEVLLEIIVATNSNVCLEVIIILSRSNYFILESVRHDKIKTWTVIKHQINDSIVRTLLK